MPWLDIVQDDRFKKLHKKEQYAMAQYYFDTKIKTDNRWSALTEPERNKFLDNYYDTFDKGNVFTAPIKGAVSATAATMRGMTVLGTGSFNSPEGQYWKNIEEDYSIPIRMEEKGFEAMLHPSWWAYHVGSMIPSIASMLAPQTAVSGAITGVLGGGLRWTPTLVSRLATVGGLLAGGVQGALPVADNTFRQVKYEGGSDEEARMSAVSMGLASTALNAISVGQLTKDPVSTSALKKFLIDGSSVSLLNWIQAPINGLILKQDAQQIYDTSIAALPSVGPSFLAAGIMGAAFKPSPDIRSMTPEDQAFAISKGIRLEPLAPENMTPEQQTNVRYPLPYIEETIPSSIANVKSEPRPEPKPKLTVEKQVEEVKPVKVSVPKVDGEFFSETTSTGRSTEPSAQPEPFKEVFYQEVPVLQDGLKQATPEEVTRFVRTVRPLFADVVQSEGQLYNPLGAPINAAYESSTGTLFLSKDMRLNTIGHESVHALIDIVTKGGTSKSKLVDMALSDIGGGSEEVLAERIGDYFSGRGEWSTRQWIGEWINLLSAEAKYRKGDILAAEDLTRIVNSRIEWTSRYDAPFGSIPPQFQPVESVKYQEKKITPKMFNVKNIAQHFPNMEPEIGDLIAHTAAKFIGENKTTWSAVEKDAETIFSNPLKTYNVLQKVEDGKAITASESHVIKTMYVQSIDNLIAQSLKSTIDPLNEDLQRAQSMFNRMTSAYMKSGHEAGLALASRQLAVQDRIRQMQANAMDYLHRQGKVLRPDQLEALKKVQSDDLVGMVSWLKTLENPSLMDYLVTVYKQGLISNIPTQLMNVMGNALWYGMQVPHTAIKGSVDWLLYRTGVQKDRIYYASEAIPLLMGWTKGVNRGVKYAKETLKTGETPADMDSKMSMEMVTVRKAFEHSPHEALRKVAPFVTAFGRALGAVDVFFKAISFDAEMQAIALRKANKAVEKGDIPITGRKAFIQDLLRNPTFEAKKEALEFAKYVTFTQDPGFVTKKILSLRNKDSLKAMHFVLPFINTAVNIFTRGIEMTPGVGLARIGAVPLASLIASQLEGALLSTIFLSIFDEETLTGDMPADANERDMWRRRGMIPRAVRIGDRWIQYGNIDPFSQVLNLVADTRNAIASGDEMSFTKLTTAIINNLVTSSWMNNFNILYDEYKIKQAMYNIPANMVPYSGLMRTMNRTIEAMDDGEAKMHPTKGFMSALSQTIPFRLAEQMQSPAKLNAFGEEIELPGGALQQWIPMKWSMDHTDFIEDELSRLNIHPALPDPIVTINKVQYPLDDDLYREYAMFYGASTKKALYKVIGSPMYNRASDIQKLNQIQRAVNRERIKARLRLIQEIRRMQKVSSVSGQK